MAFKSSSPPSGEQSLAAYGLTVQHALGFTEPGRGPERRSSSDFSVLMQNDVRFSQCNTPSIPIAKGRLELIRVEVRGPLLTIADVWGEKAQVDGGLVEQVGARLYALRTLDLTGATAFMLLTRLPLDVKDDKFFPAEGTVVIFDEMGLEARNLRACGRDRTSGTCQAWIFDAREV